MKPVSEKGLPSWDSLSKSISFFLSCRNQEWQPQGHPRPLLQPLPLQAAAAAAPEAASLCAATARCGPGGRGPLPVPGWQPSATGAGYPPSPGPASPAGDTSAVKSASRDAVQVGAPCCPVTPWSPGCPSPTLHHPPPHCS